MCVGGRGGDRVVMVGQVVVRRAVGLVKELEIMCKRESHPYSTACFSPRHGMLLPFPSPLFPPSPLPSLLATLQNSPPHPPTHTWKSAPSPPHTRLQVRPPHPPTHPPGSLSSALLPAAWPPGRLPRTAGPHDLRTHGRVTHMGPVTHRQVGRQAGRQVCADRQAGRQASRWVGEQAGRQAGMDVRHTTCPTALR